MTKDSQGKTLRAGQTVQYQLRGDQVPEGWRDPAHRVQGLCGRAQVLRVLSDTQVQIDLRERMGIMGEDPGDFVTVHPRTLYIVK